MPQFQCFNSSAWAAEAVKLEFRESGGCFPKLDGGRFGQSTNNIDYIDNID